MPTDNHDLGRDSVGNTKPSIYRAEANPGYETTDVNVGGVVIFLGGLFGFVLVFFVFCFVMGKVINNAFIKEDGPVDKWHAQQNAVGPAGAVSMGAKRENLASSPEMQQRQLQQMTTSFSNPRLQTDDGNQDLADLHAREDLLLENYSSDAGVTRIPIERAMELVAQRGLPVEQAAAAQPSGQLMAGDPAVVITKPLTNGFARTGYELDVMEARAEKLSYGKAEAPTHAELKPIR